MNCFHTALLLLLYITCEADASTRPPITPQKAIILRRLEVLKTRQPEDYINLLPYLLDLVPKECHSLTKNITPKPNSSQFSKDFANIVYVTRWPETPPTLVQRAQAALIDVLFFPESTSMPLNTFYKSYAEKQSDYCAVPADINLSNEDLLAWPIGMLAWNTVRVLPAETFYSRSKATFKKLTNFFK